MKGVEGLKVNYMGLRKTSYGRAMWGYCCVSLWWLNINNMYDGKLLEDRTCKEYLQVQHEGRAENGSWKKYKLAGR